MRETWKLWGACLAVVVTGAASLGTSMECDAETITGSFSSNPRSVQLTDTSPSQRIAFHVDTSDSIQDVTVRARLVKGTAGQIHLSPDGRTTGSTEHAETDAGQGEISLELFSQTNQNCVGWC